LTVERRSEDELRARLRQQAAVADLGRRALAGSGGMSSLLGAAVERVAQDLGSPYVAIVEAHDEPGEYSLRAGASPEGGAVLDRGESVLRGGRGQATFTLATSEPVISPDLRAEDRFRVAEQLEVGLLSSVSVPIGDSDAAFGVIAAYSRRLDDFSEDDVAFVRAIANIVAAAVVRDRAEEDLRHEQSRLRAVLARVSESEVRFRELADIAPVFIWTTDDAGLIDFINRGWLDFTGRELEDELGDTWTLGVHPEDAEGVRESWWRAFRRRARWEREYRLRRHDGVYRWIFDRGQARFVDGEFVGYVGTATDIHQRKEMEQKLSRAYERDHQVAETLQRSLLPERLPDIDGVGLEARYLPAAHGTAIGGDWYDALELDDGRVAVVVGDVVGHGLRAATVMGQLRNAFRAYALVETTPAATLGRLNRLLAVDGRDLMATALCVILDRDTGEIVYASAGHPPALIAARGGARFLDAGRSVPLGTADPATYTEAHDRIEAGGTLLLYTDGLVERRDTPLDDRLAQLRTVAGVAGGELGNSCDEIINALLGGTRPADDVALLAVRPLPVGADEVRMRLAAEPSSLPLLRRRLGRFLHAVGASAEEQFEIALTVSEAAANAIEHAYGPGDAEFDVLVALRRGEIDVTVSDAGTWREPRPRAGEGEGSRGRGLTIIRGLMDEVDVIPSERGTTVRMRRRLGIGAAA
jgi:PAS domain S-box-containing protein